MQIITSEQTVLFIFSKFPCGFFSKNFNMDFKHSRYFISFQKMSFVWKIVDKVRTMSKNKTTFQAIE